MMSISNVSPGAAASGYYKEEGYYKAGTPEAEQAAEWFGKAAEDAALTGNVDDARFAELLGGQSPDGKLMGRHVDGERQHRPGLDLTFSASKSASIAALVMGDDRITQAHDKAVREAMKVVEERFITTRWQQDGVMHTGPGKGIIAGIFRHDTSRALDPNLHSHAVIANMVLNEKGEYTALRNESVFRNQKLITEVYRSSFEQQLRELGIETRRGKFGEVNLPGISQQVIDHFSKRRQEILAALDDKGIEANAKTAENATLATRAAKHKDVDRGELRSEWRKEALESGLDQKLLDRGRIAREAPAPDPRPELRAERPWAVESPEQDPKEVSRISAVLGWMKALVGASAPQRDQPDPETPVARAVTQAIAHVSERQSVYDRSALTAAALRFSYKGDIEQVDREIDRRIEAGSLFARGEDGQTLTDRASVKLEQSIIQGWRAAERVSGLDLSPTRTHPGIADLDATLASEQTLTPGQRDAILTTLSGDGRYVSVQGLAGTGKTYMTSKLTELAADAGYEVKGFAPSHQAVRELGAVTGEASTLARVILSERTRPQQVDNSRAILLVDESSMVSARDMKTFMDYAERTGAARVVFLGDDKQLDAVSAGQPFAQLQAAGMRTAVMDEIQRQKDDTLRAAVYDAVRGDIASAFDRLGENVRQLEDPRQAAALTWLAASPEDRADTRILTLTNAARAEITAEIREGLRSEGSLAPDGVEISALSARTLSGTERLDARSYAPGDVVQSVLSNASWGLDKNQLYVVQATDAGGNALTLEPEGGGDRITLPLEAKAGGRAIGRSLVAYAPETRELAAGDAVRVRITDAGHELVNGDRARITGTEDGFVTLENRDGREIALPASSLGARGLEHDYAATAHSVQGESIPHVIVAMNARDGMATQKAFYVEISRAVESATLFTDNPKQLALNVAERTGEQATALDTWHDGALERPKSDEEKARVETVAAVSWGIAHLSERSSTYERNELAIIAMRQMSVADPDAVLSEIDRRIEEGSLFAAGDKEGSLTDKASVALESSILMTFHVAKETDGVQLDAHAGREGPSALSKKLLDSKSLTDGQREAVMTALTGPGRYVGVQGYAGTGKTYMLESVKQVVDKINHYADQSGYEVKGYAPTHQAVSELSSVLGSGATLASLLTEERHDPQDIDNSRTILIVDESSMIGAKDMRAFMNYAERTNVARVVFVGDTQQLDAVARGQPFDQLQEAGMPTAVMDEIQRQRDADLKAAVYHSIRGEIGKAFDKLGENVREEESPVQAATAEYLSRDPEMRTGSRIVVLTNEARAQVNAVVRKELKDEGQIADQDIRIEGLTNSQFTEAQLVDARRYEVGQRVLSLVNSRNHGLEKHGVYYVTKIDPERNRITVADERDDSKRILPLSAMFNRRELGKSLVAYDPEERKLAAGDAIRFRITDKEAGIANGLRATIATTEGGMIEATTQDGKTFSMAQDSLVARGIEHDYATTAHGVQGASVPHPILVMLSDEQLVNQKSFYVVDPE